MNKLNAIIVGLFLLMGIFPLSARVSPHETVSASLDNAHVIIVYGRPYTKSPKTGEVRKIWGGLVPYGKVWRTGADEATMLVVQKPVMIGQTLVPAGAYTLYTLPAEDSTQLIINKELGQWGTDYDEKQDLARIHLKKDTLTTPVDQFTMALTKDPSGGELLTLSWESTSYSILITTPK